MQRLSLLSLLPICAILASCGPAALLCTDSLFQAAAPEVIQAWRGLSPWRDARTVELPPGSGLAGVRAALGTLDPGIPVLVGVGLSPSERAELSASSRHRLFFFVPDTGVATITVERAGAWELVAKAAASGQAAAVLFPRDASPGERDRFLRAWQGAGGGALTSWIWPQVGELSQPVVFQWVGSDADSLVLALGNRVVVHGNPGTARPPGSTGLTWRIREAGLGDFLWSAVFHSGKDPHFLPLETVPANR